jgi:hypothetical protein
VTAPWQPPEPGPDGWATIPLDPRPLGALRDFAGLTLREAAFALDLDGNEPGDRSTVQKPEGRGTVVSIESYLARAEAFGLEVEVRVRKKSTLPTPKSP